MTMGARLDAAAEIRPEDLVDLDRYPIADMDGPAAAALVRRCRDQFDDAVSCHLPGFLKPDAVRRIVAALPPAERAHLYAVERGAYNLESPKGAQVQFAAEDPYARLHRRHQSWYGQDDIGYQSALSALYAWPNLTRFVAAVLDQEPLHTIDDPLMAVLINASSGGDELGWHVDSHDFAVTILLQEPEAGGLYQYVPFTGPGDRHYAEVPALFAGDEHLVRTVPMAPGSLVLFRGRNTLHRVTPSLGARPRLLALFAYEPVPGRVFHDSFRQNLLGRTRPRA
ncbi:hypothetical protein [Zavarzinia sp.]|uniref:HalD/BesD family halogenase n=1 Tax=Zavarzinia sp. TaxID=2027920 RepID=UPI00356ACD00